MGAVMRIGAPTVWAAATLATACVALPAAAHAAPRAEITGGPAGTIAQSDATFTFHATEQAAFQGYDCRLDGGPWQRCDPPQHVDALQPGRHAFEVRLLGLFVDDTPARREWTIVEPAPPGSAPASPTSPATPSTKPTTTAPATTPAQPATTTAPAETFTAGGCRNGAARAAQTSNRNLALATLCLVNAERRRRDLPALRSNLRLRIAAARHASDMAARDYFAHDTPEGRTATQRIAAAGYMRGWRSWSVGEVLHWASGDRSSPSEALVGLLRSPTHRRLLLSKVYRDVGIAVLATTPNGSANGATYVLDLGRRR